MQVSRSRVIGGPQRPLFVARRRRRPWPVLLLGAVVVLPIWWGMSGQPIAASGDDGARATSVLRDTEEEAAEDPAGAPEAATPPFATFSGLSLYLPTDDPVLVGFHEASSPAARELRPTGTVVENENTTKFVPPDDVTGGSEYLVLSSRGRVQPATSAVDLVMHVDDPVRSPVHGTVADVRGYDLYGAHEDYRVEIMPAEAPQLRVVLIHVDEVAVEVGDTVRAGETILAGTARSFPFGSQIDRYTEPDRWPHVHLEVKHQDDIEDDEDK